MQDIWIKQSSRVCLRLPDGSAGNIGDLLVGEDLWTDSSGKYSYFCWPLRWHQLLKAGESSRLVNQCRDELERLSGVHLLHFLGILKEMDSDTFYCSRVGSVCSPLIVVSRNLPASCWLLMEQTCAKPRKIWRYQNKTRIRSLLTRHPRLQDYNDQQEVLINRTLCRYTGHTLWYVL